MLGAGVGSRLVDPCAMHDRTVGCVAAAALRAAATLAGIDCYYVPAWVHPRAYLNTYSIYARMYCIYTI